MRNFYCALWYGGTGLLALARLVLLCNMVRSGQPAGVVLAIIEGSALVFGLVNVVASSAKDFSLGGLWIPVAYLLGVFLVPRYTMSSLTWTLVTMALLLQTWALLNLRSRFTFGGSSWVSLCEAGPYRFIRHPQLSARLLFLVAGVASLPTPDELLRLVVAILLTLSVALVEESFLRGQAVYREYRLRVPYRFVPGVA